MLYAGLDGIKRNLVPPKPVEEDVYGFDDAKLKALNIGTLPETLKEALGEFEKDPLMKEALGAHAYESLKVASEKVWNEYKIQVTEWEISRYLESI